ncbi:unnamed protein product [Onchocerca flexuosa]|uniref:Secreted protein n=1 Tax=Onchocerca flexuosa TaxID=387005 RepID=A0A183I4F3_9BILA|nr:unnamed protein product [Onchocerca flexuosa]
MANNGWVYTWIAKVALRYVSLVCFMQPRMTRIEKCYLTALILHEVSFRTDTYVCIYVLKIGDRTKVRNLSVHMIRESVKQIKSRFT